MNWREEKRKLIDTLLASGQVFSVADRHLDQPGHTRFSPSDVCAAGRCWKVYSYGRGWEDQAPAIWSEKDVRKYLYIAISIAALRFAASQL